MVSLEQHLFSGGKNLENGNIGEAIRSFNCALNIDGRNPFTLSSLGFAYFVNDQLEDAEESYKMALELEPENNETRNRLAGIYLEQERFDEASAQQKIVLEKDSLNIRARVGLGCSYLGLKRLDDAISEYSVAIKQGLTAKVNLGWSYIFSGKKGERRIQASERTIEKNGIVIAYCDIIKTYNKKRDYLQALKYTIQLIHFEAKTKLTDLATALKP